MNMPQPMPHPRPDLPQMQDSYEEPFFNRRQRDLSGTPNKTNNSFVNVVGPPRQASRESNNPPVRRTSAMSANVNSRRAVNRKAPPPFTAQTIENQPVEYIGTATKTTIANQQNDDQDIEVKTLRFELSQQSEVILLKTETVTNLTNQLDQQKRRMTTEAQKVYLELNQECERL